MNPGAVLRRRREVRFRVIEDEAVVLLQDRGEVLVLNRVGARLLELVDGRRTLAAIVDTLLGELEVDRGVLEADVLRFAGELVEVGVVAEAGGG